MKFLAVSTVLLLALGKSQSANILFLHPYATPSHIVITWPLAKALEERGHKVSFIATVPGPATHPNISYLIPSRLRETYELIINSDFGLAHRIETGSFGKTSVPLFLVGPKSNPIMCEALLSSPDFQEWIRTDPQIDLVITESNMDCSLALAWRLESKVIVLNVIATFFDTLESLGGHLEMVSSLYAPYKNPLSFWQRLETTAISLVCRVAFSRSQSQIDLLVEKYLAKDGLIIPPINELVKNIALVFNNAHPIEEHRRSFPPNFISLPGIHIKDTHHELGKELQDFLGSQKFIYISFGTLINLSQIPTRIRNVFFDTIRGFPDIKFLWKWDVGLPKDVPMNVYLAKYFAQQDVLGGRPSTQEAMFNAVPMIIFPVLGDQNYNAVMLEELGVSMSLEISNVTVPELSAGIMKLINGDFKERSSKVSDILKDTPMKSLDTGVWWVEHTLRRDSMEHLQPWAIHQSWAHKRLLDVWLFLAVTLATVFLILVYLTQRCISLKKSSSKPIRKLKAN